MGGIIIHYGVPKNNLEKQIVDTGIVCVIIFILKNFLALFKRYIGWLIIIIDKMYNIDPAMKRRKQTRVRKQLVKKSLHEESEEFSQVEVQQKVTKKYHNYLQTLRKIGDYDWTDYENTNNSKVIYPSMHNNISVQFLQASTL